MSKKVKFQLSGVGYENADVYHDGKLYCNYVYISSDATKSLADVGGDKTYQDAFNQEGVDEIKPIYVNFSEDEVYRTQASEGMAYAVAGGSSFSIYKREYQDYTRKVINADGDIVTENKTFIGEWQPVVVDNRQSPIRDFNIVSGKTYQYVLYPTSLTQDQQLAYPIIKGIAGEPGDPLSIKWNEWCLIELIPMENEVDAPILRKTYKADLNNIWLFKYGLETGAQTQNLNKGDIQTLGQYNKIGYGNANFISGEVSCLLGSEIIRYDKQGYVERLRGSLKAPLSTNEKILMLEQWRKIAFSKNPKLLQDIKGQSWIVQIMSSNNTPRNFYINQPDTISFSWKQIDSTQNVVIYGEGNDVPLRSCQTISEWKPKQETKNY